MTGRRAHRIELLVLIGLTAIASSTRWACAAGAEEGASRTVTEESSPGTTGAQRAAATQADAAPEKEKPERTILLHGKVLGPGDRPVAGARLFLNVDEWTDSVEVGTSDAAGSYRIEVPYKTLHRTWFSGFPFTDCKASLLVTAEGLGAGWEELPDVKGGRTGEMRAEYAYDFHLAADFPIAGRIVDGNGKPVARAVVDVQAIIDLADRRWWKMPAAIKAGDTNLMNRQETDPSEWFNRLYPRAWKMIRPATTDAQGRFQLAGMGANRVIRLSVEGPGIRSVNVSVLTRDDVADFTQAVRDKYPRTPDPDGYFYPPRKGASPPDGGVRLFGPSPTIEVDPARTVAGIVRDATTGEPIAGLHVKSAGDYANGVTDREGRYRLLRMEDNDSIALYTEADPEKYLTVVKTLNDAKGLGEIAADFEIPQGVVIDGRVLEAGTDRPVVSAPRRGCHDIVPGPLVAGYVYYFPLASNAVLRGGPTGPYFEGFSSGTNYFLLAVIGGDGRFRLAVPPGPGVVLFQAAPGLPMFAEAQVWKEEEGFHRLFPYSALKTRAKDDGAPEGDAAAFAGLKAPIPVDRYHAYRVINPPADAKTLDLTLPVPRAPSRVVRFVDPDGRPIRGVQVKGMLPEPRRMMSFVFDRSEAEIPGLEPGEPREVTATSEDGKFSAEFAVSTDDPPQRTVRLEANPRPANRLKGSVP